MLCARIACVVYDEGRGRVFEDAGLLSIGFDIRVWGIVWDRIGADAGVGPTGRRWQDLGTHV